MPDIIQILQAGTQSNTVWSVIGLEQGGGLWFGMFQYKGGGSDPGPTSIAWRPIEVE